MKVTVEVQGATELAELTIGANDAQRNHIPDRGGQLAAAELLKLASAHGAPPGFFEADEDLPW